MKIFSSILPGSDHAYSPVNGDGEGEEIPDTYEQDSTDESGENTG